jgi:uncharacterized membrane protein YraQ (UPF0718 family)
LYSGPAINVLAIVLTARILGWEMGVARAVGAVLFSVLVGLLMAFMFRKEDAARTTGQIYLPDQDEKQRTLTQDALHAHHGSHPDLCRLCRDRRRANRNLPTIFAAKWYITGVLLIVLALMLKGCSER